MTHSAHVRAATAPGAERSKTLLAAALAVMLGMTVLYATGLAQPAALHDAAHDARHAAGLPCH